MLLTPDEMGVAPAPVIKTVYYKSDKVKQLQTLLNEKFGASLNPDGVCGPLTIDAMLNALNSGSNNTSSEQGAETTGTGNNGEVPPTPEEIAKEKEKEPLSKKENPTTQTKEEPSIRDEEAKTTATDVKQMLKEILGSSKTYNQNFPNASNYLNTLYKGGRISYEEYFSLNNWLRRGAKNELEKMEQEKMLQEKRKRNRRK